MLKAAPCVQREKPAAFPILLWLSICATAVPGARPSPPPPCFPLLVLSISQPEGEDLLKTNNNKTKDQSGARTVDGGCRGRTSVK